MPPATANKPKQIRPTINLKLKNSCVRFQGYKKMGGNIFFDPHDKTIRSQRHLPHWRQQGKVYFVTFRLKDSLPQEKLETLGKDRALWIKNHGNLSYSQMAPTVRQRYRQLFNERVHDWLDAGAGSCILKKPPIGKIVADALAFFNRERYELGTWVVAANHVHVLVTPYLGVELSAILHSWKPYSANQINKLMERSDRVWMSESFDHLVRNPRQLAKIETYILSHSSCFKGQS